MQRPAIGQNCGTIGYIKQLVGKGVLLLGKLLR